jgi:tetratricopeptide (TPR) repeat protein
MISSVLTVNGMTNYFFKGKIMKNRAMVLLTLCFVFAGISTTLAEKGVPKSSDTLNPRSGEKAGVPVDGEFRGYEFEMDSVVSFRVLRGEELRAAYKASDYVQKLLNEFTKNYRTHSKTGHSSTSSEALPDFQEVVDAYKVVILKYVGTEIGAKAVIRLGGLYNYRRDYDGAIAVVTQAAKQYAGTPVENDFFSSLGLMNLQGVKEPAEASKWFKMIPKPSGGDSIESSSYNEAEKDYLAAQQSLIRCELKLNKYAHAKRRCKRLMGRYPMYESQIARQFKMASGGVEERDVDYLIIDKELDAESRRALLTAGIRRQWHVKLISHGDDAVGAIMDKIRSGARIKFVAPAVRTLGDINSDASQQALLDLALGKNIPIRRNGFSLAARKYVENLDNKADAWKLLKSKNNEILSIAVRALQGEPVGLEHIAEIEVLLQSDNSYLRINTVKLITQEPEHLSPGKKISLLCNSLKTVKQISHFDMKIHSNMLGTEGSLAFCSFVDNLTQIPDAKKHLRKELDEFEGLAKITVKIALVKLGDTTYKKDVMDFLSNEDMYALSSMRLYALRSIGKVKTQSDQTFLERLSKEDPYEVVIFRHKTYEFINGKTIHEKDMDAPFEHPDWPNEPDSIIKNPDAYRRYLLRYEAKEILQEK